MFDYFAAFAAQSEGAIQMDAWYPGLDELQLILDDMEKAGHKKTPAYRAIEGFLLYAQAKNRYSAKQTKIRIE